MSKLRVIKDRKLENNDEKDLRGLAELKSLNDAHPIVHLTVSCGKLNAENALLSHLEKINFMDIHFEKSKKDIHFNLRNFKSQSVKEQTVSLFVLSLIISNSFPDLALSLWVSDKFKFHYSNELKGDFKSDYSPNNVFKNSFISGIGKIQLNGYTMKYLKESGFKIDKNVLSNTELKEIGEEELISLSRLNNEKISKVG